MKKIIILSITVLLFVACEMKIESKEFSVPFDKIKLENGLEVVFHIDRSDPVVAVALTAHVGSAREKEGRTGFAHLFEHLLFLESENLGKGGLDKMSARIGGSGANGSTSRDRTNYFQTVPNDALEKMLWAEADKLGWFINTVSDNVLAKEKQVVKNEKRLRVDNRPYGHTSYVIDKALYPKDHPYNWQVIGSLEDLQNATLPDVKEFFNQWYVPNNSTLVVSGDFNLEEAKKWVHKYFDEIPMGNKIASIKKRPVSIDKNISLYYEDNFARLPELTYTWPTVEMYHKDSYALSILANYLSRGKSAPFYKHLVEDKKLTSNVRMFSRNSEIAGQYQMSIRAYNGKDLDEVSKAVDEAFELFEKEGISDKDLSRIKAGQETSFYNGLASVLGKGFQLAQYNIFAKDPGFLSKDIQNTLDVTKEDVMRVYKQYIQGKNKIATSFVPKGNLDLALEGSTEAEVQEEKIIAGAEEKFDASIQADYERTPSKIDRTVEPAFGKSPIVKTPTVWEEQLANGLKVYGIENNEVALVQYNIVIDGGKLLDDINKVGVANLMASMLNKGTTNKTAEELENAIQQLGASININANTEDIRISVNTLSRNYQATLDLVTEMLLESNWNEKEFDLIKQSTMSRLRQQLADPSAIANNSYNELIYGKDNLRSKNILGSIESVEAITIDDLKSFYEKNISPSVAKMHVVGDIDKITIMKSLSVLNDKWLAKEVEIQMYKSSKMISKSKVYFYDFPEAKQSVLNIGYPALSAKDSDYYPATVMNYILGGGGFASQLTQNLREGKGYTYGIRSGFRGSSEVGVFTISSNVRTNVTLESVQLIKEIMDNYGKNYSTKDLETTKGALIKSSARSFETMRAKLGMLENISSLGLSKNYAQDRIKIVEDMSIEKIQELANQYLNSDKMIWLIVGDAKTQLKRVNKLGFGKAVLLK